jgi:hypothetical protein
MGFSLTEEEEDPLVAKRAAYMRYLETMSAATSALGAKHFSKDARYQGPFYDVYGRAAIVEHFMERFAKMPDYRLKIRTSFVEDYILYLRCDAAGTYKGNKKSVSFMSEVTFDLDGLVCSHIDYYDPLRAFLFDLPMLGGIFKSFYKTVK